MVEMGLLVFTFGIRFQCTCDKRNVCSKVDEQTGTLLGLFVFLVLGHGCKAGFCFV